MLISQSSRLRIFCACHTSNLYSMAIVISIADVSLAFVRLLSPCLAMPDNFFFSMPYNFFFSMPCNTLQPLHRGSIPQLPKRHLPTSDRVVEINKGSRIPLCSFGTSACYKHDNHEFFQP
ncbi:hypothetical protein D6C76_10715 [Aureobasidium pullulans]|nr:hypothetical protein D6C76_10715 [Aureobasidium pullulans]